MRETLLVASQFEGKLLALSKDAKRVQQSMEEAYKLGGAFEKLQEENAKLKASYSELEEKHKILEEECAKDAATTKEAFNTKVKEHDAFIEKLKNELLLIEHRAREKKNLTDKIARLTTQLKNLQLAREKSDKFLTQA